MIIENLNSRMTVSGVKFLRNVSRVRYKSFVPKSLHSKIEQSRGIKIQSTIFYNNNNRGNTTAYLADLLDWVCFFFVVVVKVEMFKVSRGRPHQRASELSLPFNF